MTVPPNIRESHKSKVRARPPVSRRVIRKKAVKESLLYVAAMIVSARPAPAQLMVKGSVPGASLSAQNASEPTGNPLVSLKSAP